MSLVETKRITGIKSSCFISGIGATYDGVIDDAKIVKKYYLIFLRRFLGNKMIII